MNKKQAWVSAMRPRTLPLALASIGMGAFLAAAHSVFNGWITFLCILTTIFLQILSNLANDYGDSVHGADSADRAGPSRAVQAGLISKQEMLWAMLIAAVLSIISGVVLVWVALGSDNLLWALLFIALGGVSIGAAINYTAGKNPYGYSGWGDIAVFVFFGLLGVLGPYFLQAGALNRWLLLPAASCGAFATAVLNINNMRDIESDRKAGKFSIPVRLGLARARLYHWGLLLGGFCTAVLYVVYHYQTAWQWLFVLVLPLLVGIGRKTQTLPSAQLDPLLKKMVLTSLLFVLTFGIGQLL